MADKTTERFLAMRGRPPEEAGFFWSGGPIDIAPQTYFVSRFAGVTAFDTGEGIVLVDSGPRSLGPAIAKAIRSRTSAPIHTAIFTHGHVDHTMGLSAFLQPDQAPPRVVAHRAMMDRFKRYERTIGYNAAINARQFGASPRTGQRGYDEKAFERPAIEPNVLFDDAVTLQVGGLDFDVCHGRGETDDHCFVYCPQRSVLCTGDFIIWALPNAGNPQKVQRYAWDWAATLRRMADLNARSLCPGHGAPIVDDPAKVRQILTETADLLDLIVDRTIAVMNDGAPPHVDIAHAVELPKSDAPWLLPIYDEAEFIVRNIVRYYGGWWNGRPSDLKPSSRDDLAREIAALAGGASVLMTRAEALARSGNLRLACHLADYALEAAPSDKTICVAVAALYEQRASGEFGLMSEHLYRSAAEYARDGRAFR
jgi:glyoxylase-like metal-dependent hydrolase (beta-lactamase superfamily II)